MIRISTRFLFVIVLGLATSAFWAATASADFVGINATIDPLVPIGDPVVTPPLTNSDTLSVPVSMLFINAHPNWAGVGFTLLYDPGEINFTGLTPRVPYFKTNAPAAGPVSLPTLWHGSASASGIFVGTGFNPKIADIDIHVTGTSTINNGDTDLRITLTSFAFNIFHVTDTGTLPLAANDFVYVAPAFPVNGTERGVGPHVPGGALPTLPAVPAGGGVWVKLANPEVPIAFPSAFYGQAVNPVGKIKIEHAGGGGPAVPALTLGGLGALIFGLVLSSFYVRRRQTA